MKRRQFLQAASSLAMLHGAPRFATVFAEEHQAPMKSAQPKSASPIIDAHIHLYDTGRPGGVPWPEKADTVLYRPALPARYRAISAPLGVVGAIAVECSPLETDNDWLLNVASRDAMIVGVIGDLDPSLRGFPDQLQRLARHPLFRGIRYGNLWGRNLGTALKSSEFIGNLKLLCHSGLLLETANPNASLIADLLTLTDRVPGLRIVIDHLPQAAPPSEPIARKDYETNLFALSRRPQVFVKGSEVFRRLDGKVVRDLGFYKNWLDQIWDWFGEDRLFYGSDWPNSDHMASYADTLDIISEYVSRKGTRASDEFFWKNSLSVYGWKYRTHAQQQLSLTDAPPRRILGS
jgi:L-fuconolactonase